jgi:hypothetical protein
VGISQTELAAFFQLGMDPDRLVACTFIAEDPADLVLWARQAALDADGRRLVVPATLASLDVIRQALGGMDAVILLVGDPDDLLLANIWPIDLTLDADGHWQPKVLDSDMLNDALFNAEVKADEAAGPAMPAPPPGSGTAPPADPRLKGVPLHLRNRPARPASAQAPSTLVSAAQAAPATGYVAPANGTAVNPPFTTVTVTRMPEPEPLVGAFFIKNSKDPLCQVLAPLTGVGKETFLQLARYALNHLDFDAWFIARRDAAQRGAREPQLAAVSLFRLEGAYKVNLKDAGVAALFEQGISTEGGRV